MMRKLLMVALGLAALTAAGCTKKEFEANRAYARKHPEAVVQVIGKCERQVNGMPYEVVEEFSRLTRSSMKTAASVFCNRLAKAFVKGRLTYEDGQALGRHDYRFTPNLTAILRGH